MRKSILFLVNEQRRLKRRLSQKSTWLRLSAFFLILAIAVWFLGLGVSASYLAGIVCVFALMYSGVLHIGEKIRKKTPELEHPA